MRQAAKVHTQKMIDIFINRRQARRLPHRMAASCLALALLPTLLAAQATDADSATAAPPRLAWHVDAITEGQWNMSHGRGNWVNLLWADMGVQTWKGGCIEVGALATGSLNDGIADDMQDFSNINAGNRAFRLTHLGIGQAFSDRLFAFVGLREADEDYFNTEGAGIFTGSSYGCVPHAGDNFALGVYPDAALGLHIQYCPNDIWHLCTSLYNGTASDRLDHQFRFRPGQDGLINLGSITLTPPESLCKDADGQPCNGALQPTYVLGYAAGWQYAEGDDGSRVRKRGAALWASIDQPLGKFRKTCLNLFATGGARIGGLDEARGHWAAALLLNGVTRRNGTLAMGVSQAYYAAGVRETDFETTFHLPLLQWLSLQPALHVIRTDGNARVVGNLRICICLGND